jgi:hypothetical protein
MPRKYEKPRLTKRDEQLIRWIAEQQVVRFDTLSDLFTLRYKPISNSDLYSICDRWKRMGYIRKERIIGSAPMILWPTRLAMKLSGLPILESEKFGKPNFSTIHHNCAVSAVRLEYERNGYHWTCERQLRFDFTSSHLPDGIAENNDFRIIVEVDCTQKERRRLQNIMAINARSKGVSCVDYWVVDALLPIISSNATQLPVDIRDRIRVFALPMAVN